MTKQSEQPGVRLETDTFGDIEVPVNSHWGAQTQRALANFIIGEEILPIPLVRALATVKRCAAKTNFSLGLLKENVALAITGACDRIIDGEFDDQFPLSIWQSGSGTQSHMNMNEVIASIANEALTGRIGGRKPVHPNDHVNLCQSTNDSFPSAMHIATAQMTLALLRPALHGLLQELEEKSERWSDIIKVGRTHTQDATPVTLGQVFSGYAAQVSAGLKRVDAGLDELYPLAQGATAVGTGLNAPAGFAAQFITELRDLSGLPFLEAENKFEAIATHDAIVSFSGALNTLAVSLNKIANDIRFLGSGPRCGIGELVLPANEPGSSIMPGKVNPTQCEALSMVCAQVMGNHVTITMAGAQGHFELNAFKPVIASNVLQSVQLLGDAVDNFRQGTISGLEPARDKIQQHLTSSLMLVTALTPELGYDLCSKIATLAFQNGTSIREEAIEGGYISRERFEELTRPQNLVGADYD